MGFLQNIINKAGGGGKTLFGKGLEKFGGSLGGTFGDLLDDTLGSVKGVLAGIGASAADVVKSKNQRNNKDPDPNFTQGEVSLANRHSDAIANILSGVFSGNLFDAGLDAIQLYNYGTKWWVYKDQLIDKDLYPFKYFAYHDAERQDFGKTNSTESGVPNVSFLDTIEDPTTLGFTMRCDYTNSPLFNMEVPKPPSDTERTPDCRTVRGYIQNYSKEYPQLKNSLVHHSEFVSAFKMMFESPEARTQNGEGDLNYRANAYKNHYITKVDGLDKLDNPFVNYEHDNGFGDELKIQILEDVRLSSTRLAFLYNNMVYSRNMGTTMIPNNLLNFTLYIKIADTRAFTRATGEKDLFRDVMRNASSRIIYELKDCQLFFDPSLPNSSTIGGFGNPDTTFATVNLRIRYKRVHRIFYGRMFDAALTEFIIGDKFFRPDDEKTKAMLKQSGFDPRLQRDNGYNASRRRDTSNNIAVVPSLTDRLANLKTNGLFTGEDDDDTALTRFLKTLGNKAVKTGAGVIDEGLHKFEDAVNGVGKSISQKLHGIIQEKTVNLGTTYSKEDARRDSVVTQPGEDLMESKSPYVNHPSVNAVYLNESSNITAPGEDLMPYVNGALYQQQPSVNAVYLSETSVVQPPREDLMPAVNGALYQQQPSVNAVYLNEISVVVAPREDLMPDTPRSVAAPSEDLMPTGASAVTPPQEDLMPDVKTGVTTPKEDLMPDVKTGVTTPKEDLMPDVKVGVSAPRENLMSDVKTGVTAPKEDLMPDVKAGVTTPKEDLMPTDDRSVVAPGEDLMPNAKIAVTAPKENLMPDAKADVVAPAEDLMPDAKTGVNAPKEDLMPDATVGVNAPKEDLMPNTKVVVNAPMEDLMPVVTTMHNAPKEDLMLDDNSSILSPIEDLMPTSDNAVGIPIENLMSDSIRSVVTPAERLMSGLTKVVTTPTEDLMPDAPAAVKIPSENLIPATTSSVVVPNENLMTGVVTQSIISTEDLMPDTKAPVVAPTEDLMPAGGNTAVAPTERLVEEVSEVVTTPNEELMAGDSAAPLPPAENLMGAASPVVTPPPPEGLMGFTRFLKK